MLDGLELMSAFAHNMENYGDKDTKTPNLENYTGNLSSIIIKKFDSTKIFIFMYLY